ncbi:MAG TPA: DNA polymerase III subunit delta [Candidatus Acidoferrum sp.]|nr:DNA polymerase III subunit delta [Candidatus Acidoferrum sp.]
MPQISAGELLARLEKGKPIPAILLLGEETYLRDTCRAQLIDRFVPEAARAWAVSRFSADRNEVQAAVDQAQTLPMLSPQQLVFLEEAEVIESLAEKKREEAVKALETYLENPASFTILVLEAAHLDQRMRLAKLLVEKSLVVQVGLGEKQDDRISAAIALAKVMAREDGVEFEKGAAEDLAESVSADLQRLKTEITKLSTFVGDRKLITRHDVATLVISEKTATVWELADMLAMRQSKRALEFLDRILREGEQPLQILGALTWMYRKLMEASELRTLSNPYQAAGALKMRPDQAELAINSARKISKPRLLAGLRALQVADSRLKGSGGGSPRTVLEFLLAELTAPDSRAATH